MKRFLAAVAAMLFLILHATPEAHPTGSTFVIIRVFGDGRVGVDVTANAELLALTLTSLATNSPTELLRLTELESDGHRVALKWSSVTAANAEGLVTVHLEGTLPARAETIRWRARYMLSAYPIAVTSGSASVAPDDYDWLAGSERSRVYHIDQLHSPHERAWRSTVRLVPIGFTHILPGGLDHVLFMLGLFVMASRRALVLQITTFTAAHSLTLALGVLGVVHAPARIVEPLIAASIAFIAFENLFARSVTRWRLPVVFVFGLLHGLGFAGAMADLGLSGRTLAASLVGFNVGVELGQLAVIVGAALTLRMLRLSMDAERRYVLRPASAAIALTGLLWAVTRISG